MKRGILESGTTPVEVEFADISSETSRTYTMSNGLTITLEEPAELHVSKSGSHRVVTKDGNGHYIARATVNEIGWVSIEWIVPEGEPVFAW